MVDTELRLALYYYYTHKENILKKNDLWQFIDRAEIVIDGKNIFVMFEDDLVHKFTILDNREMQFEGEVENFEGFEIPDNYGEYINNEVNSLNAVI